AAREGAPAVPQSKPAAAKADCPACCSDKSRASLLLLASKAEAAAPEASLRKAKLAELLEYIKSQPADKLVLVDVWADFCIPCKKAFPHLIAMHEKYAKHGLVCIPVAVDEPEDHAAALRFLQKQRSPFANFHLQDRAEVWQDHWNIKAIPAVFLYRDGKQLARFDVDDPDNQFTYADVEKAVIRFLKK